MLLLKLSKFKKLKSLHGFLDPKMVSIEEAVKQINYKANDDNRTITSWNSRGNEVEYSYGTSSFRTYYKSFTYLSDRSQIYTYIEGYLRIHHIPHTIQIRYDDCWIYNKKEKKQVREKKLLYTITIA